jgi:hypothetical protein
MEEKNIIQAIQEKYGNLGEKTRAHSINYHKIQGIGDNAFGFRY